MTRKRQKIKVLPVKDDKLRNEILNIISDLPLEELPKIYDILKKVGQSRYTTVDAIKFKVESFQKLSIKFFSIQNDPKENNKMLPKEIESYEFNLDYQFHAPKTELDKLSRRSPLDRKSARYIDVVVLEQFTKPLLGKLLNQIEEVKRKYDYNESFFDIEFENFNFFGSTFISMSIVKHIATEGTFDLNRNNNKKYEIVLTDFDKPLFRILFSIKS